jgi:glycosyltransferase involved in cell wall biosynthesis
LQTTLNDSANCDGTGHVPGLLRIAYFVHWNAGLESGVFKKVLTQIRCWRALGNDVKPFVVTRSSVLQDDLKRSSVESDLQLYPARRITGAFRRFKAFSRSAERIIEWEPDLVYCRYDRWYPAVTIMGKQTRLVIEVNSDDIAELNCQSRIYGVYNRLTRDNLINSAKGVVFVSGELARLPHFAKFHKPHLILGNSISLTKTVYPRCTRSPGPPRLVFMGQRDMPWHGLDKILSLASQFPRWSFHLIGVDAQDFSLNVPNNVVLCGTLTYPDYQHLLFQADCALGTLALHRKGMHEACPLKTREYLAHGLPVVIGYTDTDFPEGAEFLLQLSNTEDNVVSNIERIRIFVESWCGRRVGHEQIRHLDVNEKERIRLRFLNQVVALPRGT